MRKMNKFVGHIHRNVLFAQGVKRIVYEKEVYPTDYRDYELDSMQRKEKVMNSLSRNRPISFGPRIADVVPVLRM
jgi:hypothetical protein